MARRTVLEIKRATIVDERGGVLALSRQRCLAIDGLIGSGKMDAEFGSQLKRSILQFADDVAIGLHVDGEDLPGVRDAMRPIVKAAQS